MESDERSGWRGESVAHGRAATFQIEGDGASVPAFIASHRGAHYAYVNRCPHAGTRLDWPANQFFTPDGLHLVCVTHGAIFAPDTGICVEGPCAGARLIPLLVAEKGGSVVVTWPS